MGFEHKYRVHWADGMKINKDHFIDLENSMLQQLMMINSNYIHQNNFGLLPDQSNNEQPVNLSVSMDGQETLVVVLNKCFAVTLGGGQIIINEAVNAYLEQSGYIIQNRFNIDQEHSLWYIVVSVNPYNRVAIGFADPDEEPARKPYVISEYNISLVPESAMNVNEVGYNSITVGKVILENNQLILVDDFIPPCTSIQSHPELRYTFTEIGAFFNAMELYNTHIVQKIYQNKQNNDLAKMALILSNDVLVYLKGIISEYRIKDKYEPPVGMILKVMNLARIIKGSLDVHINAGKEEFLNYLTEWCGTNQGEFENVLQEVINLEYIHIDISTSIQKASEFTMLMNTLFKKLSELEYIGKKNMADVFVKEDKNIEKPIKKRRRFFDGPV
ncbi:hypothetical protein AWE51_15255 [Aquimarina aggregata]|uniref:Uncharacterized protein n=1 Tax=Aquimarina aggregata TaxID=1642818 RepID=A0A162Y5N2_9FLAO|nr:hypothetical protein [Aquimarina aggregata]KZS38937.1 hypothetical protein AWE51_15255 [Aquimarina aggregata]